MKKMGIVGALATVLVLGPMGSPADADTTSKTVHIGGAIRGTQNQWANRTVMIERVGLSYTARGTVLQISGGTPGRVATCNVAFSSAADAAAMQARILDPKARSVDCNGAVTAQGELFQGEAALMFIQSADALNIEAAP
jgi:hypothetical protein